MRLKIYNCRSNNYLTFQIADTIQGLCSYLRGVLSTRALLEGLGVGKEGDSEKALLLYATTRWIYRDGASMMSSLIFTYFNGNRFGKNIKGWRLFADVSNDIGLTLELLAPLVPFEAGFTAFILLGTICKSLCGVAAGATRSSITAHFAKDGNIADVSAKEQSQETLVSLIGMLLGLYFIKNIEDAGNPTLTIFVFGFLTVIHVIANYIAVSSLQLRTLNKIRLLLQVRNVIDNSQSQSFSTLPENQEDILFHPLSFAQISDKEPIFYQPNIMLSYSFDAEFRKVVYVFLNNTRLGPSKNEITQNGIQLGVRAQSSRYIVAVADGLSKNSKNMQLFIFLHEDATEESILSGMIDCILVIFSQFHSKSEGESIRKTICNNFPRLLLKQGWEFQIGLLDDEGFRHRW